MIKFPSLFTKTPSHKRFNYMPRHYDPQEEERKARDERIRKELQGGDNEEGVDTGYRTRIAGSFRTARKLKGNQFSPSTNLMRLMILTFLVVWLIAYLQYGNSALYALLIFVPVYIWIKFLKK